VAAKYDLMNDLMSFGIHRLWKRFTIDCSGVRKGQKVLDLAGGTGDLTAKFSRIVGETGQVVLADINDSMLKVGRDKLRNLGVANNVSYVQANAEALPFPDNHFDVITIGFGLRNVTDKDKALASMFRVLKPGGRLLVLEFSKPVSEVIAKLYDLYSFKLLPKMGEIVANDSESYKYLAESIRMHPDQQTLAGMMENVGWSPCTAVTSFKVAYADGCHGHRGDRNQPQPAAATRQAESGAAAQIDGQGTQAGAARAQATLVCLLRAPAGCAGQIRRGGRCGAEPLPDRARPAQGPLRPDPLHPRGEAGSERRPSACCWAS